MRRSRLIRLLRVGLVLGLVAGASFFTAGPASAHDSNICTSMTTGGVNELSQGAVRQLSGGHLHDIAWSFSGTGGCNAFFPTGGNLRVRVRFLQRNASGGCTTNIIGDGALRIYTAPGTFQTLATDVLSGTCYRLIWRPTNSTTANRVLPGTIALRD